MNPWLAGWLVGWLAGWLAGFAALVWDQMGWASHVGLAGLA